VSRWPRVHVLLVNYNGWRDTVECLESVLRLDYPDFRVIVCDNASADNSLERLQDWADGRLVLKPAESEHLRHLSWPPVRKPVTYREYSQAAAEEGGSPVDDEPQIVFVRMPANAGFAGGNNVGFRYLTSRGEPGYAWVLNNDTVVAPDALRRLVEVVERDEAIGVVGSLLFDYAKPDTVQAAGGAKVTRWNGMPWPAIGAGSDDSSRAVAERIDFVHGASMLIPLSALTRVGPFDERYFLYSEEADWCFRMKAHGLRVAYAPAAMVWHKGGQSTGRGTPLQDYFVVRNTLFLVHRFFRPFVPVALLYSVYRCFLPKLLRGQWARVAAVGRAYRDFIHQVLRGGLNTPMPTGDALRRGPVQRKAS
jgi:GT2 family glycosyltransferase